jgi:hypothetical protein
MRREAEHADDDGAQHHVVDLEPGPRIVDQVPKASIRGNELGGHDHEKADREAQDPATLRVGPPEVVIEPPRRDRSEVAKAVPDARVVATSEVHPKKGRPSRDDPRGEDAACV